MASLRVRGTGTVLAAEVRLARSVFERTRGLMFASGLPEGTALDIRPCNSIHMMFVRFPIDAVFYDRDGTVTKVARRLRPWTGIALGGRRARGVIELPGGAAAGIREGDTLEFPADAGAFG